MAVFDDRRCSLGEGLLWHPERQQIFWIDILGKRLCSCHQGRALEWQFDEYISAAGWIDHDRLLLASETQLLSFDLTHYEQTTLCHLEADTPLNRSNDGRADPWGGFWIGTMSKKHVKEAGAIYRYFRGKITKIHGGISIPNSICFSPDRKTMYFADTLTQKIQMQALDHEGWPKGPPKVFVNLTQENFYPDGSVIDSSGCLWNAQWAASRVAQYSPDGRFIKAHSFPASQISCPAFGGGDLKTLFATSARKWLTAPSTDDGKTFALSTSDTGVYENQVKIF